MGIDPGASGAIAFYFPEFPTKVSVVDFSLVDGEINCSALADLIKGHDPQLVVIEQVHSMPKQGVASTFKFGVAYGMARGVVASLMVPQVYVTPGKWKKFYGLSAEKEKSRELAIQTWPASDAFRRKKDHGRAEAALLALYGAKLNGA
jgi:crossover junction endodeoxyribonuclease RuvC